MNVRAVNIAQMNDKVKAIFEELKAEEVFLALDDIDEQMKNHPNCKDKEFYQKKQDEINQIYNKLLEYYYDLTAILETYISCRSFALMAEYEVNKTTKTITVDGKEIVLSRAPGREILKDACVSEVPDLNYAVLVLKGWTIRANSALKTARNHTYSNDNENDEQEPQNED